MNYRLEKEKLSYLTAESQTQFWAAGQFSRLSDGKAVLRLVLAMSN
ncbi:MAG: hypothetical protein HC846_05890 [Blastocatellia bacterium]|nr:hypothetical protein [Blastocatellia bacterium]